MPTKPLPQPKLSKSDERCIWFVRTCRECKLDPLDLARLCALTRQAGEAATRECNIPNYSSDRQRERVEVYAASMGMTTEWNGLYPTFKLESTGAELRLY